MNLKDLFPTLGDNSKKVSNKNGHLTKKGPGRYHDGDWRKSGMKFIDKIRSGKAVHLN